jgi:DNA-binding CsgD family transcriptional regulator
MKKQLSKIFGLFSYLIVLGLLFDFNWILILSPKPFFSVILGMVILTASQYKKGHNKEDMAVSLRWNLVFSSFLTTLISILSSISPMRVSDTGRWGITESLLPMLYGSIIYLILNILLSDPAKKEISGHPIESVTNINDLFDPAFAQRVFIEYGLTNRECHVALKLLENISNKEIASQLYISEATVKKHIQNIYQKFRATDRNNFKMIYIQSTEIK